MNHTGVLPSSGTLGSHRMLYKNTPAMVGRLNIGAPTFAGTDLEQIVNWQWKMEAYLETNEAPYRKWFTTAIFYLSGDAENFAFNLAQKVGKLDWSEFTEEMTARYDKTGIRANILRQQLDRVEYDKPSKMLEYCAAFRAIEQ